MTDREAIRRLGIIVSELAYATGHQNFTDQAIDIIEAVALAEPAAPTVTGAPFRPDDPPICSCREFYDSHPPDCPTQRRAPTVTREQAQHISNAVIAWMSKFGAIHLFHDLPTEREMPAFFRAVADALDKEA